MASVLDGLGTGLAGYGPMILYWVGICFFTIFIFGMIAIFYFYKSHNLKFIILEATGAGNKQYGISKIIHNVGRKIEGGQKWKLLFPIGNKEEHGAFSNKYVYPGSTIFALKVGDKLLPIDIDMVIDPARENILGLKPIPNHIREWQSLKHKQHAEEFAKLDFWEVNRPYIIMFMTILFCIILTGVTIYFTFKYGGGKALEMKSAADGAVTAFKNINIGGVPLQ